MAHLITKNADVLQISIIISLCCLVSMRKIIIVLNMLEIGIFLTIALGFSRSEIQEEIPALCRERYRTLLDVNSDYYHLVDGTEGGNVLFQCNYCGESHSKTPRLWYKQDLSKSTPVEVKLDVYTQQERNRVYMTLHKELVIRNMTSRDVGMYRCYGLDGEDLEKNFNFLLDVTHPNATPIFGNLSSWSDYQEKYLLSFNNDTEVILLQNSSNIAVEALTEWEPWGPCISCTKRQGEQRRLGRCRLRFTVQNTSGNVDKSIIELFKTAPEFSCCSDIIARKFPQIINISKTFPDYVQVEFCDSECLQEEETEKLAVKKRIIQKKFVLHEGAHLTLACPQASIDSVVTWEKDEAELDPDEEDASKWIDDFGTLYLISVGKPTEGEYTCYVDDIKSQVVVIGIIKKEIFVKSVLLRHMAYLGYILLLTTTCYCGGLTMVIWRRRKRQHVGYSSLETISDL